MCTDSAAPQAGVTRQARRVGGGLRHRVIRHVAAPVLTAASRVLPLSPAHQTERRDCFRAPAVLLRPRAAPLCHAGAVPEAPHPGQHLPTGQGGRSEGVPDLLCISPSPSDSHSPPGPSSRPQAVFLVSCVVLAALAGFGVALKMSTSATLGWTGRSLSLLDPTYAAKHMPLIASVSEHQASCLVTSLPARPPSMPPLTSTCRPCSRRPGPTS